MKPSLECLLKASRIVNCLGRQIEQQHFVVEKSNEAPFGYYGMYEMIEERSVTQIEFKSQIEDQIAKIGPLIKIKWNSLQKLARKAQPLLDQIEHAGIQTV
ncbi:hypothetical protein GYMLUDRAFT_253624 [Collybiopsis luxurians FD-317 M1]|uniref:Uncharacterized protein n=1 Tax=Collybiopsis luxurians FD-317 M1 TaxID=944289 RepID=A0A0D0AHZ5_9AGAR|nr:hypothetical protein GYMLUDRAFT_253624 [Collybiopsis luxurians FD-317 M1]